MNGLKVCIACLVLPAAIHKLPVAVVVGGKACSQVSVSVFQQLTAVLSGSGWVLLPAE